MLRAAIANGVGKNVDARTKHLDVESQRLLEFAAVWAPYGGTSEEDILVNFGMTTDRFVERLWQVLHCGSHEIDVCMRAYPDRRHGNTAASNR